MQKKELHKVALFSQEKIKPVTKRLFIAIWGSKLPIALASGQQTTNKTNTI